MHAEAACVHVLSQIKHSGPLFHPSALFIGNSLLYKSRDVMVVPHSTLLRDQDALLTLQLIKFCQKILFGHYCGNCIKWQLTWCRTARHIKSHGYPCIPRIRQQANVSGLKVIRQQVCLLCVSVFVGLENYWHFLPHYSVLTVTDVIWRHPIVFCSRPSLCSDALYSMRRQ